MSIYYLFFGVQITILAVARIARKANNLGVLAFLVFIGSMFAGLRGNNGTDTYMYRTMCLDVWNGRSAVGYEPMFRWLAMGSGVLFGEWTQVFIFSVAIIQGILLFKILQIIKEKDLYYVIFISTFYIPFQFNQIRVGVALLLMSYAYLLSRENNQKLITGSLAVLALLTHITIVPFTVLFIRRRPWLIILTVCFVVAVVPFIATKLDGAVNAADSVSDSYRIGAGYIITIVLIGGVIAVEPLHRGRKLATASIFLLYAVCGLLSGKWFLVSRIAVVFEGMLYLLLLTDYRTIRLRIVMLIIAAYHIYGSLIFIGNSDEAMKELIARNPGYAAGYQLTNWIPYKFFWRDDTVTQ